MIEKIAIEDRDQWLGLRNQDVTASIAGALLGVHPYSTAYGLYLLKKGLIAEDPEETGPMRRGRLLEPVAVQMLREDRPNWIIEEYPIGYYFRDPATRIGATPDVFATNEHGKPGIVQLKSVEPSIFRRDWKTESGMVEPPLWIVVQAILECYLTGREWAAVAPLVVGFGLELPIVDIPIHAGIFERIKLEVDQFWKRIESGENYPPDWNRDGQLIAQVFHETGEVISLESDNLLPALLDERQELSQQSSANKKRLDAIKAELLAKMNGASEARVAGGRTIKVKRVNVKEHFVSGSSQLRLTISESRI